MIDFIGRSEVLRKVNQGIKVIGFGAGELGEKTHKFLENKFDYFVDNYRAQYGESYAGNLIVNEVSTLENEDIEKCIIIICSEHYEAISKQLNELNSNFKVYISPLLKNYEVFDRLKNSSSKLLVTSYGAEGGLFLVNTQTQKYTCLKEGNFRGATFFEDKIIAVEEYGHLWSINSIEPFEAKKVYESDVICQSHGIVYCETRKLFFKVDASFDRIEVINPAGFTKVDEIKFTKENVNSSEQALDQFHMNDLCIHDNDLYVSFLSKTGQWKQGTLDGCILKISLDDYTKQSLELENLTYPHSVEFIDGEIAVLEALKGRVLWHNEGEIVDYYLPGFLRGMGSDKHLFYIGQSRNRHIDRLKYLKTNFIQPGIYIISKKEKAFKFVSLPEYCDVYHILNLDR